MIINHLSCKDKYIDAFLLFILVLAVIAKEKLKISFVDYCCELDNTKALGITAGASAPEILVENLIRKIKKIKDVKISNLEGIEENIKFKIPKEL